MSADESVVEVMKIQGNGDLATVYATAAYDCAAVIVRPSFYGLESSAELIRLAKARDQTPVLSSMFDGGVGLAHLAIVGSLAPPGIAHGISTFDKFKNHSRLSSRSEDPTIKGGEGGFFCVLSVVGPFWNSFRPSWAHLGANL